MTKNADFLRSLSTLSQELTQLLEEHLSDNFGKLLPHLYMADVERHVETLWARRSADRSGEAEAELRLILQRLEDGFREGDPGLCELIGVSFLEHLPYPGQPGGELRTAVGPALQAELALMG